MSLQTELKLSLATAVLWDVLVVPIVVGVPVYGIASLYALPLR